MTMACLLFQRRPALGKSAIAGTGANKKKKTNIYKHINEKEQSFSCQQVLLNLLLLIWRCIFEHVRKGGKQRNLFTVAFDCVPTHPTPPLPPALPTPSLLSHTPHPLT